MTDECVCSDALLACSIRRWTSQTRPSTELHAVCCCQCRVCVCGLACVCCPQGKTRHNLTPAISPSRAALSSHTSPATGIAHVALRIVALLECRRKRRESVRAWRKGCWHPSEPTDKTTLSRFLSRLSSSFESMACIICLLVMLL